MKRTATQVYFNHMSEAIDEAYRATREKGFEPVENMFLWERVQYGKTVSTSIDLIKDGKMHKKCLHVQLYRMESGRYELNHYIS